MESRHDRYFKNYRPEKVPAANRKGYKKTLVYIGDLYTWDLPDGSLPSRRRWMGLAEAASLVIFLVSTLIRTDLNRAPYIAAPSLVCLAAWFFEFIAMGYFVFKKLPLREDDYQYIDRALPISTMLRFLLLSFTTAACLVDLVRFGIGPAEAAVTLGYALTAALAFLMFRRYRALSSCVKITPS